MINIFFSFRHQYFLSKCQNTDIFYFYKFFLFLQKCEINFDEKVDFFERIGPNIKTLILNEITEQNTMKILMKCDNIEDIYVDHGTEFKSKITFLEFYFDFRLISSFFRALIESQLTLSLTT